jgi:hypothetical protein
MLKLLPLIALLGTAVASGALISVTQLASNPGAFQLRWVSVRGFVAIDELGHQYLFATLQEAREKNFRRSIDLVSLPDEERSMRALADLACADIYGRFTAYGKRFLPSGYLLSDVGEVEIKRVSTCPAQR